MQSEWAAKIFGDKKTRVCGCSPYSAVRCPRVVGLPGLRSSGRVPFSREFPWSAETPCMSRVLSGGGSDA